MISLPIYLFITLNLVFSIDIELQYKDKNGNLVIYNENELNSLFLQQVNDEYTILSSNCAIKPGVYLSDSTNNSTFTFINKNKNISQKLIFTAETQSQTQISLFNHSNEFVLNPNETYSLDVNYVCSGKGKGWSRIDFILESTVLENKTNQIEFSIMKICSLPQRSPISLMVLMCAAVLIVIFASQLPNVEIGETAEDQELKPIHAILFILVGSIVLMLLYFLLKYLIVILTILVCLSSTSSLTIQINEFLEKWAPRTQLYLGRLPYIGLFSSANVCSLISSVLIVFSYLITKNWILNNIIGLALVTIMIRTVKLQNLSVGVLLLSLAFFYDIFWVFFSKNIFGSSVMTYVAVNVDLPMKILCPIFQDSPFQTCSLLGLGDMALPGFFIAFALRFDQSKGINKYFRACIWAYSFALLMCLSVLIFYNVGQPALLYISPCLIFVMIYNGIKRGELHELWHGKKIEKKKIIKEIPHQPHHDDSVEHDRDENYYRDNTLIEISQTNKD